MPGKPSPPRSQEPLVSMDRASRQQFQRDFLDRLCDVGAFLQLLDSVPEGLFFLKDEASRFVWLSKKSGSESDCARCGKCPAGPTMNFTRSIWPTISCATTSIPFGQCARAAPFHGAFRAAVVGLPFMANERFRHRPVRTLFSAGPVYGSFLSQFGLQPNGLGGVKPRAGSYRIGAKPSTSRSPRKTGLENQRCVARSPAVNGWPNTAVAGSPVNGAVSSYRCRAQNPNAARNRAAGKSCAHFGRFRPLHLPMARVILC